MRLFGAKILAFVLATYAWGRKKFVKNPVDENPVDENVFATKSAVSSTVTIVSVDFVFKTRPLRNKYQFDLNDDPFYCKVYYLSDCKVGVIVSGEMVVRAKNFNLDDSERVIRQWATSQGVPIDN